LPLVAAVAKPEQTVDPRKAVSVHSGDLVFSLLPKSFQRNPVVDFTVITEMTDEGRKVAAPSSGNPVYYETGMGTYLQLGQGTPAGEKSPAMAELEKQLRGALAANGYLPAKLPKHQPSIQIIFYWGSHSPGWEDANADDAAAADQAANPDVIPPISGTAYAEDLLPLVLKTWPDARN
jgi:hypothetical protein